ncbi:hypothetical protein MSG28_002344 [Choristoneura fumiferana]|uniref:Uncharacterized protein n=1 Tax=Choristoneura fumiferana TaxID=7141 RepID=A0ACC0JVL2_CHOFU|nr:hypothetical protein MSG28_002344 [Choristoneura fumiferana]
MGNQFKNVAMIACLKTFLFIFNVVFWFDLHRYMELSSEFSGTAPLVVVGLAGLIVLVSSVAFSCIIKGQPVLLYIYGGFLACIFVMDAGVGASVACYRDTFAKGLHDGLTQTLITYDPHKGNFDFAQANRTIPTSCCVDPNSCVTANYSDVYQESNMNLLMGIAIGTALFPLVGTILSCFLASYIKKSKYDVMN